ncbi:hypothetical protein Tco_0767849 [Tanacetum coccineum]
MSRSLLVPEFSQVSTMNNLKFVFMFNGKLMQCIQSGELRYVDGEERVVCVDRNILLSRLVSMVIELHHCSYRDKNNPFSFVLFYGVEQAEDCLFAPLTCDKDVKCMVDKYYRILETLGRYYPMRLGYGADVNGGRRCLEFALNEPDKVREYLDNCRNSGGTVTNRKLSSFSSGFYLTKLPPSWKSFSKKMLNKTEDYSLDDLLKFLRIEEEARTRDKQGKDVSRVYHVQGESSKERGFRDSNKAKMRVTKNNFKKSALSNRSFKCHVCGETGHFARE